MADVEEIKKRLDIVQIISEYLTLKKSGVTYKALCPFHVEKTPSFTVSAERGTWHCFGCNEGGDVISFVQKIDNLEFTEALEKLAARAGIEIKPMTSRDRMIKSDKTHILEVLELSAKLYHEILLHHPTANEARSYLDGRGIDTEMIEKFRLGYAPQAWHTIEQMLQKRSIDIRWAKIAGLSVQKDGGGGIYDRFRGRLMFPIDDPSGQIVGFTGRILTDQPDQPKYLNTSESLVFKKGEILYALSKAKNTVKSEDLAIMVEGQMDVIAAHQFNFLNTVATSGTALTEDHLRLLKRFTTNIAFAFDADAAGMKAAWSAVMISLAAEINPLVILTPYGKDPDECIRHDKAMWEEAITKAQPAVEFFIDYSIAGARGDLTALRKKNIAGQMYGMIDRVVNTLERTEYLQRLAHQLGVSESVISEDFKRFVTKTGHTESSEKEETIESASIFFDLERQTIGLLLTYFGALPELPEISFENQALGEIYQKISQNLSRPDGLEHIFKQFPSSWQNRLNTLILETQRHHDDLEEGAPKSEIEDCLNRLLERERDNRIANNASAIAHAFSAGNKDEARQLLKALENDTITTD